MTMTVGDTLTPTDGETLTHPAIIGRNRKRSFGADSKEQQDRELKNMITPPNSTVRKVPTQLTGDGSSLKHPLSPELSSPIAPTRTKKSKSDGGSRSNGNLTIDELLNSLEHRRTKGDCNSKPPYSYATLIGLAILQSEDAKLTLSQIYNWISKHFPYYKQKDSGWQNSIRHNLSLNDAFIKTDKSCDGKGHFWEVKSGFETKFFKNAAITYEEIRSKLRHIDRFFSFDRNKANAESSNVGDRDSDYENENNAVLHVHSSPNAMSSNIRISVPTSSAAKANDEDNDPNDSKIQTLHPPYLTRKYHTSLGLPKLEDFNRDHNIFIGGQTENFMNSSTNSSPSIFKTSHDFKKYTCSFNSSFEELSPSRSKCSNDSLLDPVMTDSFDFDNLDEVPQRHSIQQSPLNTNTLQHNQMELLRTPRNPQQPCFERTPCRFMTTPRDENSVMKKWQTPSHLFEDLYSPIFKYIGTPTKDVTSPGGSKAKHMSPRKLSAPHLGMSRSKISAGGLFGVDVYAVWKRATENLSLKDSEPNKENAKTEGKFDGSNKCESRENKEKDINKGYMKGGD